MMAAPAREGEKKKFEFAVHRQLSPKKTAPSKGPRMRPFSFSGVALAMWRRSLPARRRLLDSSALMPARPLREYAHPALLAATVLLLLIGIALFWTANSFEGYIIALLVMAIAGLCFEGRRELQARDAKSTAPSQALPLQDTAKH